MNRLIFGSLFFTWLLYMVHSLIVNDADFIQQIIIILFSIFAIRIIIESQAVKGLSFQNNKLYATKFIGKIIMSTNEIDTSSAADVVILRYKMSQLPNWAYTKERKVTLIDEFNYEVHLLNENHSNRNLVISLESKEKAIQAAEFIEQHSTLFYKDL